MATQQKKVTKSKGKSARRREAGGSKGQSKLKKKMGRTRTANRTTKKISRSQQQSTAKNLPDRYEAPAIEDSGAVKKARSSVENIVEDAQEKVEETTEPVSYRQS